MKGAIFYSGQYGSTAQYADWISEATGLPVFNAKRANADPADFDFVVLGSSVIIYKLTIRKWVARHLPNLLNRPVLIYTVSGAAPGPKLDGWVHDSLPTSLVSHAERFAFQGRLDINSVGWWTRTVLKIGAMMNKDPEGRKDELHGFDYMDKSAIDPLVARIHELTATPRNGA
ncbi:flavodoxin domain-containing protein [uncultured Hyphomonas sp.]|uniref:flavodoxin domain-containing protein n=1 Tax=uncultured Hyphomonas sp. TaxID=225298 RepID=UPI002AAA8C71|nr:flavodoxin domain-containing protein [uncultured Hyphomonas sp.]